MKWAEGLVNLTAKLILLAGGENFPGAKTLKSELTCWSRMVLPVSSPMTSS